MTGRGLRAVGAAVEAAGFFLLALAVRALPWRWQLEDDRVVFGGNDAYYHARRTLWSAAHFPGTLQRDAYVNFPHGGEPIWPPLFDLGAAALLRVFGLEGDPAAAERVLAWIPPALGAACVVVVWVIGRRFFGPAAGRLAALALAVLVAHFHYSFVGFFDHHIAVVLVGAVLLGLAMELARCTRAKGDAPIALGVLALATGLVGGLGLLVWPGMLLEWAILEGVLATLWIGCRGPGRATRLALAFAGLHAIAAAVVAPVAWGREWTLWGAFSPVVLTSFQPWLLALGAVFYGLLAPAHRALEHRTPGLAARPSGRLIVLALSAAVAVAVGAGAAGDLATAAGDAWAWLAKDESFQASVSESRPLLMQGGRLAPGFAVTHLSGLLLALPFLLAAAVRGRATDPGAVVVRVLAGWTAVFLGVTLLQLRFYASLGVGMCLLAGWGAARLLRRWPGRSGAALVVAGYLALLSPSLLHYALYARDAFGLSDSGPVALPPLQQRKRLLLDLAAWIRDNTPETSGWLELGPAPEYAVLSSWTDGHVLQHVARRPAVVDNFGDDVGPRNLALVDEYYDAAEPRGSAILDELGARYVVFEYRPGVHSRRPRADSLRARLYFGDGSEADRPPGTPDATETPGLERNRPRASERHRLVWETEPKPWQASPLPAFKLYEHVAGAVVEGRAPAGARVEARLRVRTNRGRSFAYVHSTRADPDGRFRMRVPYPTASPGPIRTGPALELQSGSARARITVSETDVRDGRTLAAVDLSAPAADRDQRARTE